MFDLFGGKVKCVILCGARSLIINMRRTVITKKNSREIVEIERFSDSFDIPQENDCQVLLKISPVTYDVSFARTGKYYPSLHSSSQTA
jgi:hypothetical protein